MIGLERRYLPEATISDTSFATTVNSMGAVARPNGSALNS